MLCEPIHDICDLEVFGDIVRELKVEFNKRSLLKSLEIPETLIKNQHGFYLRAKCKI